MLCGHSGADVDWLVDKFGLDMLLIARLGGHSQSRTQRGNEHLPSRSITNAPIQMIKEVAEKTSRARIRTKAEAHTQLMNKKARVGLVYEKNGTDAKGYGPGILCSRGFGADLKKDALLAEHRRFSP